MLKLKAQPFGLFAAPALLAGTVLMASCTEKQAEVNMLELIQAQVPADTILYVENRLPEGQQLQFFNSTETLIQLELAMGEIMASGFADSDDEALAENIRTVLIQHIENIGQGSDAAIETYGLAADMATAFYFDGIYPVLQVAVSDSGEKLSAEVNATSEKVGGEPSTETIAGQAVTIWPLTEVDDQAGSLQLAYTVNDNLATLALINSTLSAERKASVLGISAEASSLAAAKTMKTLNEVYGFRNNSGFISMVEFGNALLEMEASTAGMDFKNLLGEEDMSDYDQTFTEQCRQETKALLSSVPRMVFGTENMNLAENNYSADVKFITELTRADVVQDLISLNGHQSAYVLNAADKIAAMGFGFNGSKLSTALGSLLNKATETRYECAFLSDIQQVLLDGKIRQGLMGTATLNGVQGMGLGLYDITPGSSIYDTSFDLLVTVAAENPMALVNMVKMFAPIEGLMELEEGKTVSLQLPLPLLIDLKASVAGNYIGLFTGEKSAAAFSDEAKQPLNSNGMTSASFNYTKLGEAADKVDLSAFAGDYTDASMCAEAYLIKHTYASIDGEATISDAFTENGYEMDYSINMSMAVSEQAPFNPVGSYLVEVQEDGCGWVTFGHEEIAQTTGNYDYRFDGDECAYNKLNYNWQLDGMRLSFQETEAYTRDECASEWLVDAEYTQDDFSEYNCVVTSYSEQGFECVMFNGDGKELYRYTRL
ncbi:hypothetical protein [Reinekea marinisedimentorum]|uniref:Uncharacterized protein n=1 Tax=Reinekea marinisedimentorum TaxID=230495 RepID=A0A4R3ID78_9GAMM|nr:hypothetical protein [Reinekea marinisedimentorum]TCS43716.1 hypothetical protein BCF53_10158 [Reinekea marinisedimentorum]